MPITSLPTPPSRQDPTNFNDRADAFLGALPLFQTEANALQTNVNTSEVNAVNAAAAVFSATNIVKWVSGTTYANGAVVWSPTNGLSYRRITTSGSGTTDPSLDTTNYKQVNGTGDVSTSGNQTIDGTKTFTSTISASISGNAATVTNGVYNTGDQTIGGNKTFSSPIIFPDATIQSTGVTTVRAVLFTASGTYTKPSNVKSIFIQAAGATGGRGSNTSQSYGNAGTGGAGYSEKYIASPSNSYAITIGAGGTSGGTSGGTTSVDTISITGSGGVTSTQTTGGLGGVATGGTFNANGGNGGSSSTATYSSGGGGGAAGSRAGSGFNGGSSSGSYFGGGGGGGTGAVGANGSNPSGGAGGAGATIYSASILQPIFAFDTNTTKYQFYEGAAGNNSYYSQYTSNGGSGGNGAYGVAPVYGSIGIPSRILIPGGFGGCGGSAHTVALAGASGSVVIWEFI